MFDYAETMRSCRKFRGYTQGVLARRTGINITSINQYELGNTVPSIERYSDIMNALGFELTVTTMEEKKWK